MILLTILQALPDVSSLNQYGVLGVFAILLIAFVSILLKVVWTMVEKQINKLQDQCDESEKKIDDLQKELRAYLEAEAIASKEALKGATEAINRNTRILERWEQKLP